MFYDWKEELSFRKRETPVSKSFSFRKRNTVFWSRKVIFTPLSTTEHRETVLRKGKGGRRKG